MTAIMLTAEGLSYTYPGQDDPTFMNATINLPRGSRTVLLGGNGSGKSTLLRCLSGALPPDAGTISCAGTPLVHNRAGLLAHRSAVQLVLQDPADQLFAATVHQDVSYGPLHQGLTADVVQERTNHALALMGLTDRAHDPIHYLSYGLQKRVAIAGALAMQPSMLLLDEPTAGLDPAAVTDLMAALAEAENHATILMATHDVNLALQWASHALVVNQGRVTQADAYTVLSDDDMLRQCRLMPPTVLRIHKALQATGVVPTGTTIRSADELIAALHR